MLEKVIKQLPKEKYDVFFNEIHANKGEKFIFLLDAYRNHLKSEGEIIKELNVNLSSFYTLRSRLFDKIQQFLFRSSSDESVELMKNVHSIPHILFDYPKETAIALITHLENELIRFDMQTQLIQVYGALKKLHVHSDKYYHYEQSYNKSVAYTLAHDKAEELLSLFSKTLSSFLLSRSEEAKEIMLLYLQELHNLTLLYDSSRLTLLHKIGHLNYLLFADKNSAVYYPEKTIEDLIGECRNSIDSGNKLVYDSNWASCMDFLSFHYYHQLKLDKNNDVLAGLLMKNTVQLLNLYPLTSPSVFLISLVEREFREKSCLKNLRPFFEIINQQDIDETFYIYRNLCMAVLNYDEEAVPASLTFLQNLVNFPALKKYDAIETEIKLFHVFVLLLMEKTDLAETGLRSVVRKTQAGEKNSDQVQQFILILKLSLSNNSTKQKKLFEAFKIYRLLSQSDNAVMTYFKMKEKHVLQLSMS